MSLSLQAKLLRVLQEGTVERLGSNKTQKVNVRIIAATNKNLESAIARNEFREDLYYRLKVITITLPPLRVRKEDIPLLTEYFIARHSQSMNIPTITLPQETLNKIMDHSWPGNVRELENELKKAVLLSKNQIITPDLIELRTSARTQDAPPSGRIASTLIPDDLDTYQGILYHHVIENVEKELIAAALSHTRGNRLKAAKLLGISRVMLHERIEKYGLASE
jgi:DNA-binding NtrC family response regulator